MAVAPRTERVLDPRRAAYGPVSVAHPTPAHPGSVGPGGTAIPAGVAGNHDRGSAIFGAARLAVSVVQQQWVGCLFDLCSFAGAVGAAYALRHFRRENLGLLAWCLLITLVLDAIQWSVFLGLGLVELHPTEGGVPGRVAIGAFSLLQYIAVVFVMEEVTFRMLDSHLHEADKWRGVRSVVFISAAWGLWHLPTGEELRWETVGILLYVHVPYGVCLSLFWRKTGNLVVPGLCHALGDGIRNAIMIGA